MSTHPTAQPPPPEPKRMTLEEWAELDEDEPGELVDGVLVDEEMPGYLHEFVITALTSIIVPWAREHGAIVAGSGAKFAVSRTRGRMPDFTVYLSGARRPPVRGLIRLPPSIAVEVVTATPRDERRDRVEKLGEYAAFGVRCYWLVDPELRTFEVFELGADGRYAHALGVSDGVISIPGCDGLSIDLGKLWAEVDALIEESDGPSE